MTKSVCVFLAALLLLVGSTHVCAEAWRVSPMVSEYFHLLYPGTTRGRLQTPLVLVLPSAGRVEHIISPFAGGARDSSIDQLLEILNGERLPQRAATGVDDELYSGAVTKLARDLPLEFPLVVLVRMETPRPDVHPQIPTAHDELLEEALRNWESEQSSGRNVFVIALLAR